jgi:hypothetical protein
MPSAVLPAGLYEVPGSRTEDYSLLEFSGHVDYICDWRNRYELVYQLSGMTYDAPHGYFYDYFPAYVEQVTVRGYKEGGRLPVINDLGHVRAKTERECASEIGTVVAKIERHFYTVFFSTIFVFTFTLQK